MNEDVGYVKLFFRFGKEPAPVQTTERVTDHILPLLSLHYGGHKVYANREVPGFTGKDLGDLVATDNTIYHPSPAILQPLKTNNTFRPV